MKDLIPLGDLPLHLPKIFPTYNSAKWFYRKSDNDLLEYGAIIKVNRRVFFDLEKLEKFLFERKDV